MAPGSSSLHATATPNPVLTPPTPTAPPLRILLTPQPIAYRTADPAFDGRRERANLREQERYQSAVEAFYGRANLSYDVRVHKIVGGGGYDRRRELDVERIEGRGRV